MSFENWDRQYRFAAAPKGKAGFEVGGTSREQPVPVHCDFDFSKSDLTAANSGKITLWNLNREQLAVLNEKDCVAYLRAGYGNRMSLIFSGIVSYAVTEMDGADRKTEIEVVDNLIEIRDTYVSVSYAEPVSWKKILDDTGDQMGVAITCSYNAEFTEAPGGFSFIGKAREVLDKCCSCCGLSWSIQNGVLQVKKPGDVISREVYVLSPETGLIEVPARVTITDSENSENDQKGWDVKYFLNGAIEIDDYVRLESDTVTGYFRVYSIDMSGDNQQGDWICTARLIEC